jgi:tetratricopeptide (TPR) repeat protein
MAKIGRNDPCPCGNSKKYKQCCLAKDEAAARAAAPPSPEPGPRRVGRFIYPQEDDGYERLTEDSNAVIGMIHAGDIDAAERAAHELLVRYPEEHDGYDRLGMVCEARGENRKAADYYRKAIAFIEEHAEKGDDFPHELVASYHGLIDRLDQPPAAPE